MNLQSIYTSFIRLTRSYAMMKAHSPLLFFDKAPATEPLMKPPPIMGAFFCPAGRSCCRVILPRSFASPPAAAAIRRSSAAARFAPLPTDLSTVERYFSTLAGCNLRLRSTNWELATGNWTLPDNNRHGEDRNPALANDIRQLATGHWKLDTCFPPLAAGRSGE